MSNADSRGLVKQDCKYAQCTAGWPYSRIAFLGVDQVRNFKVEGQVGLVVLGVAGISYMELV